jgi:hypothetical protein
MRRVIETAIPKSREGAISIGPIGFDLSEGDTPGGNVQGTARLLALILKIVC